MQVGERFGKLVTLERGDRRGHERLWRCLCDCGIETITYQGNLKSGNTVSCGCHRRETSSKLNLRHGLSDTKTHWCWGNMMRRCYDVKGKDFHNYGARGITVSKRWHVFENFLADMGEAPAGMTLDRERNNDGYSKDNCRWVTRKIQMRNVRCNVHATINGQTKTLAEWAEVSGTPYPRLWMRRQMGWPDADLLLPKHPCRALA